MADPLVTEPQPSNPNPNLAMDFGSLPVPPLDPLFFSDTITNAVPETYMSDLGLDGGDFEFTLDDLYLPSETEDFLAGDFLSDDFLAGYDGSEVKDPSSEVVVQVPGDRTSDVARVTNSPLSSQVSVDQRSNAARILDSPSPEYGPREVHGDRQQGVGKALSFPEFSGDHSSSSARVLNSLSPKSGHHEREFSRRQNSGEGSSNIGRGLNSPSPEYSNCNREFSGPASSQGSGNFGSASAAANSNSPDSGNDDRDVSSEFVIIDQRIKLEEMGKNSLTKRKKENEEANTESRSSKFRRSAMPIDSGMNVGNDEEDKRKARLMRNRESAQLSRQRKKHYVEELEDKVRALHSTIAELNGKISLIMAENASLRQQLGGAMCPPPPPGMYPHPPMAPMGYPWMPCAPYVVKQQGSQVPLVPIPRLRPQQPVSSSKSRKLDSKKTEGKTKKVASVSFLGLLFFILLFGGLVPIVNVKYGGIGENVPGGSNYISNRLRGQHRGRILTVNGHFNGSDHTIGSGLSNGKFDFSSRIHCERGRIGGKDLDVEQKDQRSQPLPGSDGFVPSKNSSEPLLASLYVPRNDKLVKIDGNLIIHSVMASEKAMAYRASPGRKNNEETGLAIAGNLAPALAFSEVGRSRARHSHLYRNPTERQRALTSGSADAFKDNMKSTAADGKLQQWFREGLAGPMLGSGMCTEVFQFDVSPASASGAIIPASSVSNNSSENHHNSTRLNKGRNRRILHGLPIPLTGSTLNITEEHMGRNSQKDEFQGNKSVSSMVVSVLVDPREAGDGDGDGMIGPKSLSRIFVVVLLDSVKYVTYSCVLPLKGSVPHLVTT
ncbi:hypothetical protein L1049_009396 [Liquidambar formosana]|uniref:BZIP domain-containing protein n=1 Tax=Liquidambar formosana TaxID=63359 RepID=A0AAP0S7S2_LIQFO